MRDIVRCQYLSAVSYTGVQNAHAGTLKRLQQRVRGHT